MTINQFRAFQSGMTLQDYEVFAKNSFRQIVEKSHNIPENVDDFVNEIYESYNVEMNNEPSDLLANDPSYEAMTDEQIQQECLKIKDQKTLDQDDSLFKESLGLIVDLTVIPLLAGENYDKRRSN